MSRSAWARSACSAITASISHTRWTREPAGSSRSGSHVPWSAPPSTTRCPCSSRLPKASDCRCSAELPSARSRNRTRFTRGPRASRQQWRRGSSSGRPFARRALPQAGATTSTRSASNQTTLTGVTTLRAPRDAHGAATRICVALSTIASANNPRARITSIRVTGAQGGILGLETEPGRSLPEPWTSATRRVLEGYWQYPGSQGRSRRARR